MNSWTVWATKGTEGSLVVVTVKIVNGLLVSGTVKETLVPVVVKIWVPAIFYPGNKNRSVRPGLAAAA